MSYRIFARKYRPQTFEEVIGQDSATTVLRNAIRLNRLAQAYLFVGPRGIGKTSTARILAKALNCKNGPTSEPCGTCDSCVEIAESRSLDVLEIDGASNNGVENVRELRESVSFSPARGPFKIYIIDEVHMLSSGAFNALLKTLEEPPPHVKFIFATTEIQKVPATISSRCQRFDLKRIPSALIASHLQKIASQEKISLEETASVSIAQAAEGALRDAESMLDQVVAFCGNRVTESDVLTLFGLTPRQVVTDLSALVLEKKTAEALALMAEQVANGRDLPRLLGDWIAWLRDILIQQATHHPTTDLALQKQAALISQGKLLELLDLLANTQSRIKWASDLHLQMDVTIIKAIYLLEQVQLDDVLTALSLLGSDGSLPEPNNARLASPPSIKTSTTTFPSLPSSSIVTPHTENPSLIESLKEIPKEEISSLPTAETILSDTAPSAITLWQSVSGEIIQESPFKFGWLSEGRDPVFEGSALQIHFPQSLKTQFDSIFWSDIRTTLEKRLSQKRKNPTPLKIKLIDSLPETPSTLPQTQSLLGSASVLSSSVDPMEAFKNDPLIRKALEIFKGTIQPISS